MNKYLQTLLLSAFTLFSAQTLAHEYNAGDIEIDHPWSREAPPTATVIAGFFQLKNNSQQDDYLINASTPVAKRVESIPMKCQTA